jgi:hypothetical protein
MTFYFSLNILMIRMLNVCGLMCLNRIENDGYRKNASVPTHFVFSVDHYNVGGYYPIQFFLRVHTPALPEAPVAW